jgi:hypothetical protein
MASPDKEAPSIEPWAARIGIATLVLVAGVAIFTAWERAHTSSLEEVITPTAVGDMHFVPVPAGGKGAISLKYQGHTLDMVSESKLRDAKLLRAGTDDSGIYSLYRLDEEGKNGRLFMKVGVDEFIEVKPE